MIAQVNYYNAFTRFFDQATSMLPHIKRMIAEMPFGKAQHNDTNKPSEHGYTFLSTSSPTNESDCDI